MKLKYCGDVALVELQYRRDELSNENAALKAKLDSLAMAEKDLEKKRKLLAAEQEKAKATERIPELEKKVEDLSEDKKGLTESLK